MKTEEYNRDAWNQQVENGNCWTIPVTSEQVEQARQGDWSVVLTPTKPVPQDWFGDIKGKRILGLACGGGQQGPILAAAGADVTVIDNSPRQLDQDRSVAERDGLDIQLELGVMTDLSRFADESFDLVFNPASNLFVPDIRPVWKEAYRVLKPGGALLSGVCNPFLYLFDWSEQEATGKMTVTYPIPYSDEKHLPAEELEKRIESKQPFEFGHTLEDQIGGQLSAGFILTGFYEDSAADSPLAPYHAELIATRAIKPANE